MPTPLTTLSKGLTSARRILIGKTEHELQQEQIAQEEERDTSGYGESKGTSPNRRGSAPNRRGSAPNRRGSAPKLNKAPEHSESESESESELELFVPPVNPEHNFTNEIAAINLAVNTASVIESSFNNIVIKYVEQFDTPINKNDETKTREIYDILIREFKYFTNTQVKIDKEKTKKIIVKDEIELKALNNRESSSQFKNNDDSNLYSFWCDKMYNYIFKNSYTKIKFYNKCDIYIQRLQCKNIQEDTHKFFDDLNLLIHNAKKALKKTGVSVHFRNNTGHTVSNTLKYMKRSGRNILNTTVKRIWGSNTTNYNKEIKEILDVFYSTNLSILKCLIAELLETTLKLYVYNAICSFFDDNYTNIYNKNSYKRKLIYCRKELLKINNLFLLIKDIINRFISLNPNNIIDSIYKSIINDSNIGSEYIGGSKNKKGGAVVGSARRSAKKNVTHRGNNVTITAPTPKLNFSINSNSEIQKELEITKNKQDALNIKIAITQMYNLKTDFNIIHNLIKEYQSEKEKIKPTRQSKSTYFGLFN
jgi:hypothetical protein